MGAFTYRSEHYVVLTGPGVVEVDHPGESIIYNAIVMEKAGGAFKAALQSRRFTSGTLAVYKVRAGRGGRARLYIESGHPFVRNDFVTIASLHTDYDGSGVRVVDVGRDFLDASPSWIELETVFTEKVDDPGTVVRATPAWAQPAYSVTPLVTAESGLATLVSDKVAYECSERPDSFVGPYIYVNINAAGTYLISISGEQELR